MLVTSVFKRLVLQTRKNQGLFGRGLKTFFIKVYQNLELVEEISIKQTILAK